MSVGSKTIAGTRAAIVTALEGRTIVTTYIDDGAMVLSEADDDIDPSMGPSGCAHGGFVVWPQGGETTGTRMPRTAGSTVQRMWRLSFLIRVSVDVRGVTGQRLAIDSALIMDALPELIEAGLEPSAGARYNVTAEAMRAPQRHPRNSDFYLFEIRVEVTEAR